LSAVCLSTDLLPIKTRKGKNRFPIRRRNNLKIKVAIHNLFLDEKWAAAPPLLQEEKPKAT
jgi:hypothetical protein